MANAWNWTDFCPTGITPFMVYTNDLMPCFQQICLQLPVYTIFAAISAYSFGAFSPVIVRDKKQLRLIDLRIVVVVILAVLPIIKIFYLYTLTTGISATDILVVCTLCLMWFAHCGYLLTLRKYGGESHRGILILNVFLTSVFVLDVVWLRTSTSFSYWPWSVGVVVLDFIYILTLIPKGNAIIPRSQSSAVDETQSLLGHRYVRFNTPLNEVSLGNAQDEANCASKFFFYWVNPLISKGLTGNLRKIEDLFDIPECLNITRIITDFQIKIGQTKSIFWGLHKAFGREFYLIGIIRLMGDLSGFAGPMLLGGLLELTETDSKPYFYALALFSTALISAFCGVHFNWRMSIIGMKMRIGVVSAIYRKALEARGLQDSRPEILNLMSTDTDRIVNSCISFHSFWSIPFQLFTTLYLLYTQIGAAFIAGVIFAASLIPINRWLAKKIGIYSESLMTAKDARLSATSETMIGAKQIKLHSWEDIFINKLLGLRKTEVSFLAKRKYLDALCVYFWATTPVLMCLLTFGVSVLMGNPLTAAKTYTSVALLNMLIGPLNAFPWVLNGLIEAWISIKRLQELFDLKNLDFSTYYEPIMIKNNDANQNPYVLQITNATFEHEYTTDNSNNVIFRLEKVSLDAKKGELICIEGPVGGGKSTLISGIVASINCVDGQVRVKDLANGFGYVPQSSWLQRGTIRENIIWGSVFDEQRYRSVLHACALNEDLSSLGGDLIGVGENGRTLSGGQRARISLARAVYQNKKIYLLDDVLSALDAHVANHVIKHCILGILKDRTRIIVTSNRILFYNADKIYNVENGHMTQSKFMGESMDLFNDLPLSDETRDFDFEKPMSILDLHGDNDDKKSLDSIMMDESKEYGHIAWGVLATYWNAMSNTLGISVLLFVVLMQLTRNLSDAWLAYWVTDTTIDVRNDTNTSHTEVNHDLGFYLGIYASLAASNSLITMIRSFLFAFAGIKAAKIIHDKLLKKVVFARFYFFDITSVGRILNRFSSDVYTVDDSLPFILNILLAQLAGLIGAICICLYAMPWLGLIIIPLVPVYLSLQYHYRHASRDIKRLSSNSLSPLFSHFTETLQGLTTIRAMRGSYRFQRDFQVKLEDCIKAQLTSSAAQQWLGLRLQLLGSLLIGGAGFIAALTSAHAINPGLVGLAISYALSITSLLSGVLNAVAETEQEMIAVERIDQYLHLDAEENADGSIDPPFGWPGQGVIGFSSVTLNYREHLQPALLNISFKTGAFERIAIVGRTGAGKSSILSALFRVAPLSNGEITVDSVNIKTLSLRTLRDRIVIIPQEPFLFEGSVRDNLDPRKKYLDSEIWNAITNCLATPLVQSLGGLEGKLDKGGINLSAGQRQLLCLTRALLKNSRIVCIDEGTSNLDTDSEEAIQIALRNSFKSSTVLFIAHRLKGLQNMDRIIVMDAGQIVEQGIPQDLANNSNSMFSRMLQLQHNKDF